MKNKQLSTLFFCTLIIYICGSGIMAILPIYSSLLGASAMFIGLYFAALSLAFTIATSATGWLTQYLPRKPLFLGSGLIGVLILILHGLATELWQVVGLTMALWFSGGIGVALAQSMTGLIATGERRGSIFGLMAVSMPLAALFGGLVVGPLVLAQGGAVQGNAMQSYRLLFFALGAVWLCWPLSALFWLGDVSFSGETEVNVKSCEQARKMPDRGMGASYWYLLLAVFAASIAISTIRLAVPIHMQKLEFSANAIVSLTTVAGLLTIPLVIFYGRLSDKVGKRELMTWRYMILGGSALGLVISSELWHFWLAYGLVYGAMATSGSIARAFVADLLPARKLEYGISWLESAGSGAGILGSIMGGFLVERVSFGTINSLAAFIVVGTILALQRVSAPHNGKPNQVGRRFGAFFTKPMLDREHQDSSCAQPV